MERYLRFLLAHRGLVAGIAAVISLLAILSLSRAVVASELVRLFFGDNPAYDEYRKLASEFGGNDTIFVAYEDRELLEPNGIARLVRITTALRQLPDIAHVDSFADAQRIRSEDDALVIDRWADLFARSATASDQLVRELTSDDLVAGLFIGRDRQSTAVVVELVHDEHLPMEALPMIQDRVLECFLREGLPRDKIHLAGLIPETVEMIALTNYGLSRIFPLTILLLMALVYLLFFRSWPVVLTISITLISVLWTFGFGALVDRQINILQAMVPGIMMVVGFSDVIHMYNAYVLALSAGGDRREALIRSCAEVGTASAFTALTEFVGFVSLAFVPTPLIRHAGLVLGFGVASTLVLVLTLVPIILSTLPDSALVGARRDRAGPILDRIIASTLRVSTSHPWIIIGAFTLAGALAVAGLLRLKVDTDFATRFAPGNHIRIARELIRERFVSSQIVDVYVFAESEGGLVDARALSKIAAFQRELEQQPGIERALSVIDLLRRVHREVSGSEDDPFASGAITRAHAEQYLLLFESLRRLGTERVIDESRKRMKISLHITVRAVREIYQAGEVARAIAKTKLGPELEAHPTGINYLLGGWLDFIVAGQRDGRAFSISLTLVMMMMVLGSIRVGAVSMIPNLLPLLFLGGWLGWTRDAVDSDTLIVASIAMGIAVDDTIHYMTRLRHEQAKDDSVIGALQRTSFSTGRAILQAAVVLCIGFSPFALSEYYSVHMMGTLLPLTLFVALICEVLLMPALVVVGLARFRPSLAQRRLGR